MSKEEKKKIIKSKKKEHTDKCTIDEIFKNIDMLIEKMENSNCSLEENLELYKKGVLLLNEVENRVDKVEKEIKILDEK